MIGQFLSDMMEKQEEGALIVRKYESSDCKYLAELFYETVHAVNAKDYTKEQLDVWAAGNIELKEWDRTLTAHYTVVAVKDGRIVGFGDIDSAGYLDRLYVHRDYQNQGIASAVCDELEKSVRVDKISVHASITAKPFFLSRGYKVIREQQVVRQGISLTNFVMERSGLKFPEPLF